MRALVLGMALGLLALVQAAAPALADPGLVGHWKLDEGSGTKIADSSGYGNDGILSGAVSWVSGGPFGGGLGFNGSSGYARVPDNSSLEPPTAVSVGAWFEHSGSPGDYRYLLAKGGSGCTASSYGLYTGPNGGLEFYVSRDHGTVYARSTDAGGRVWDGKWHLAVGTFDGSTIRLYVDGVQVGSGTSYPGSLEYPLSSSNDLFIGDYPGCSSSGFAFLGDIEEVTVWSQSLSAAAVRVMAQGNPTPVLSASGQGAGGTPSGVSGGAGGSSGSAAGRSAGSAGGSAGTRPGLSLLLMAPSQFAAARPGRRTRGTGTQVSYVDTKGARSTFTVLRRESGIKTDGRCVAAGRKHGVSCARYVAVARFTHRDRAGRNNFHFSGEIGGRSLNPGVYLLKVIPASGGRRGNAAQFVFRIV